MWFPFGHFALIARSGQTLLIGSFHAHGGSLRLGSSTCLNSQLSTLNLNHQLVWMVVVVDGATHGQAALFREWAPASAGISVADGAGRERYPRVVRCALRPKIRFEPAVPSLFGRSGFPSVCQTMTDPFLDPFPYL